MTGTTELPKLTGSPRQVDWATNIRAEALKAASEVLPPELAGRVRAAAAAVTDSKVWIDNRAAAAGLAVGQAIRRGVKVMGTPALVRQKSADLGRGVLAAAGDARGDKDVDHKAILFGDAAAAYLRVPVDDYLADLKSAGVADDRLADHRRRYEQYASTSKLPEVAP
jgi:hypothetical protein